MKSASIDLALRPDLHHEKTWWISDEPFLVLCGAVASYCSHTSGLRDPHVKKPRGSTGPFFSGFLSPYTSQAQASGGPVWMRKQAKPAS